MKALIAFALLAAVLFVARADLPVHCEWSQVQGKWDFRLSSDGRTSDTVYNECTYTNPLPNNVKNITVTLEAPNVARDDQGNVGTFTLIYDQGFEATLGGKRFFAFWYFTKNGDQATSHCGLTFTGWFHEDSINPQNWGCFRGYHSNPQTFVHPIKAEIKADAEFRNDLSFINKINSAQKTWTAAPYPEFEGVRMHRLLARGGRRSESFRKEAHNKHMATMKPFAQMLSKNLKVQDLPESFDWRDKKMVSPVRNQASCGSCYTFSAAGMFESRARVQSSGVLTPVFSTQDIVNCDPYDQGCEGGFTYSVSKYGRDFGIANETCEPYVGRDGKCRHSCPTGRIYVSDYKYIGGFYGATTEEGMQEAILQRGPISVDFYVYRDFFYYKSGVYVHNKDLAAPEPHFEETNHAVLAVGWGVSQDGTKYWIVKNSWGAGWGMDGYFLIRRGTDECGIESSAVEAILKL